MPARKPATTSRKTRATSSGAVPKETMSRASGPWTPGRQLLNELKSVDTKIKGILKGIRGGNMKY